MKQFFTLISIFCIGVVNGQWTISGTNIYNSNTGNVGIGTTTPGNKLHVNGNATIGDAYDASSYGMLQIVRPASPADNKFHLSFLKYGVTGAGIGFVPSTNALGLWAASSSTASTPTLTISDNQNVGVGLSIPQNKLHVVGNIASTWDASGTSFVQLWSDNAIIWKQGSGHGRLRLGSASNLAAASWSEKMSITDAGRVGIGTTSPVSILNVVGSAQNDGLWMAGTSVTKIALLNNITAGAYNSLSQNGDNLLVWTGSTIDNADAGGLVIGPWTAGAGSVGNGIRITSSGNVGVGTVNPGPYKMVVEGMFGARKIKITQALPWADYVFDDEYRLRTLEEVEQFIKNNKHLPEVPTTKEVEKEGLDLGNNQALLLKKIEELTLYAIQQDKKVNEFEKKLSAQDKIIEQQARELKEIKSKLNK